MGFKIVMYETVYFNQFTKSFINWQKKRTKTLHSLNRADQLISSYLIRLFKMPCFQISKNIIPLKQIAMHPCGKVFIFLLVRARPPRASQRLPMVIMYYRVPSFHIRAHPMEVVMVPPLIEDVRVDVRVEFHRARAEGLEQLIGALGCEHVGDAAPAKGNILHVLPRKPHEPQERIAGRIKLAPRFPRTLR